MKSNVVILLIAFCVLLLAIPVTAAGNAADNNPGLAGPAPDPEGQGAAAGKPAVGVNDTALLVRETLQEQDRVRDLTNNPSGVPAVNRTQDREQVHVLVITDATQVQNAAQERAKIQSERSAMNAALLNGTPVRAGWSTTSNEVRLAVHTLLAMENITGGIGPQVSAVAIEYNNSAWQSWQLEERIRNRDALTSFFFGGDQVSAAELANLSVMNQDRIRQITQLMENSTLDTETRALLQEQLTIMEQENTRLGQEAAAVQQNRGILGWIGL